MAKKINMTNNVTINQIAYDEAVLNYQQVCTNNASILKLAIERITTYHGEGSVQPIDGKAFIHTDNNNLLTIYALQSFGDVVAIHDTDGGNIIMLCDNEEGLCTECEPINVPTVLVTNEIENENEPESAPTFDPMSIVSGALEGTTSQPQNLTTSEPDYDITISDHVSKTGESKSYHVHGKGYKAIPKSVADKWYPAGKGKNIKGGAFWSKARFESLGGIESLRKALPDMRINFLNDGDEVSGGTPIAQPIVAPIAQPTEEGSTTATFPEAKPTATSAAPVEPVVEDSPIVKQFKDLKAKHPDALLLFRCGDFYETYFDDAKAASDILGITLTRKGSGKNAINMAGFPFHLLDTYLPKLIRAGRRVAICDQIVAPTTEATKPINAPKPKDEKPTAPKTVADPMAIINGAIGGKTKATGTGTKTGTTKTTGTGTKTGTTESKPTTKPESNPTAPVSGDASSDKPKVSIKRKGEEKPIHVIFSDEDAKKVQGILRKAVTKCGDASKAKVEFFMVAGSNCIVVSIYNDKGQKGKAGAYPGGGWLKMGEGNQRGNNELLLSYSLASKEFMSIIKEGWDGKVA